MLCRQIRNKSKHDYLFAFYSGFGADYSFWVNILQYFPNEECVLLSENYFCEDFEASEENLRNIFEGKRIIGVGHSLGYMKLCMMQEKYDFFKLEKIVAVEGFSNYLGSIEPLRTMRKLSLEYMKWCYMVNPIGTLVAFQMLCGAMPDIPRQVDQQLLISDLGLLDTSVTKPDIPHLVLSSVDDFVIPYPIIQDNFGDCADIRCTQFSSHLLGMKDPEFVANEIRKFISQ